MVAPLVAIGAGLMAGGTAVKSYYDIRKAYETRRYWNDYYKNTGVKPKYPYRSGYYDIYAAYGSALRGAGASLVSTGIGRGYVSKPMPNDIRSYMYG